MLIGMIIIDKWEENATGFPLYKWHDRLSGNCEIYAMREHGTDSSY